MHSTRLAIPVFLALTCLANTARAEVPFGVAIEQDAWRLVDVKDGVVHLTLRVKNQGPLPLENALLVLPAPSGTTVASAFPAGASHDGGLVFAAGTLVAGDEYIVRISVNVSAEGPILGAAVAHGALAGRHVTATSRVPALAPASLPAEFLEGSPDADPTDPPIQQAAAAEGGSAASLFTFVQKHTVHQPYVGSLHGARGTLYGRAGNSLDRSSLLVALLRASGIPATYRLGTLSPAGVERLYEEMFPPPGASDVGGFALDAVSLRADLEGTLLRLDNATQATLGATVAARLASLAALEDDALMAVALETTTPDSATASALVTHAWVEAWIDGAWVALDPSFRTSTIGEVVAAPTGERLAGLPESVRHHVAFRILRERYTPAFLSQLQTEPPTIAWQAASGDLVGRAVVASHRYRNDVGSGFFFYTKTTTYEPRLDVRDLERRTWTTYGGEEFKEFVSNFGGGIANDFITAVSVEIELLKPGQTVGQGLVFKRNLADRLGSDVRAGGGTAGGDFGHAVVESVDVASILVAAAHIPPRLIEGEQLALKAVSDEAKAFADLHANDPPDAEVDADAVQLMRGLADSLAGTLTLLHEGALGLRTRRLAALLGQRPFVPEPRVVAALAHIDRFAQEPAHRIALDLLHERMDTVGAPGQRRMARRTFRMAYGLAATELEASVIASVGAWDSVSTHAILAEALERNVPFAYLEGQDGLNITALPEFLAVSAGTRARIQRALSAGLAVIVPKAAVEVDGRPRSAWYEVAADGGLIGRLDDGSGGAALEYAMQLFFTACDLGVFNVTDPVTGEATPYPPCPPQGFFQGIGGFTGSLYGLIVPSISAAFACADGNAHICNKLVTNFGDVPQRVLLHALEQLVRAQSFNSCDAPMILYDLGSATAALSGFDCPGCTLSNQWLKGVCAFVAQYDWAQQQVDAAIRDPVADGEPGGVMAAALGLPEELHTARTGASVQATHGKLAVKGTVTLGHARLSGALDVAFAGGPLVVPARSIEVGNATLTDPPDAGALFWSGGLDQVLQMVSADARLVGDGTLDIYGGLLQTGVAGWATFGGTLDPGTPATLTAAGSASAVLDLTEAPPTFAGILHVDGAALPAGRHGFEGGPITVRGVSGGPLGAATVTLHLTDGGLALPDRSGTLTVGGSAAPEGLGLAGVTGDIVIARAGGVDTLALDSTADTAWLTTDPPAPSGVGPFVTQVTLDTSKSGDYRFEAQGPTGWALAWTGTTLSAAPPPGTPAGTFELLLSATGQNLEATRRVAVTVQVPAVAQVDVSIAEDPSFASETGGLRVSAYLVDVRHFGPATATYTLAGAVTSPALRAHLAAETVVIEPGATRRVSLHLERADVDSLWPAPGTTVTLSVTASGPASHTGQTAFVVQPIVAFTLEAAPNHVILAPGQTANLPIRIRAVGNISATPALTVDSDDGLPAVLALPAGPLAPGTETSLDLAVVAPADAGQLPTQYNVTVTAPATAVETVRGLPAISVTVGVRVTRPGTEGLMALVEQAQDEGDEPLLTAGYNVYSHLDNQLEECQAGSLLALQNQVGALAASLLAKPGREALAGALTAAATQLGLVGCEALEQVVLAVAGLGNLPVLPDLAVGLNPPAKVLHGTPFVFTGVILNAGSAAAPPAAARATLRRNATVFQTWTLDLPGLAPGAQHPFELGGPTLALLGHYVVDVEVDFGKVVTEGNETDNHDIGVLEVLPEDGAPPDNAAPDFTTDPPLSVAAGLPFQYAAEALDPNGDAVFLFMLAAPAGLSFDGQTLSGKVNRPGAYPVTLLASDEFGATTTQTWSLEITSGIVVNTPPVISGAAQTRLLAGTPWSWTPEVSDPDGDLVTLSLGAAPTALSLGSGALSWTPVIGDAGTHFVTVIATDARGAKATLPLALTVVAAPSGANLVLRFVTAGDSPSLAVVNVGDASAGATSLVVWEELDGIVGATAGDLQKTASWAVPLPAGAQRVVDVAFGPTSAFPGNVLLAEVDPGKAVLESDEDDNTASSVLPPEPSVRSYVAWRPDVTTPFTLLAPEVPVAWRALDPASLAVVASGVAEAGVPTLVQPALGVGLAAIPLAQVAFEADGPLQIYYVHEPLGADFGADLFHPTLEGDKVGTEFVLYVPTATPNNLLDVHAAEDTEITLETYAGEAILTATLGAGEAIEPEGIVTGGVYRLFATGAVVVQSASVTGCSAVPTTDSSGDDVGREFVFSIRSRGPGGGALAVVGYADADYAVYLPDGQELVSGSVKAGAVAFHPDLGEQRGLQLVSSAPVAVLGGDVASAGADRVGLLGEDLSQTLGRGGVDLIVPTLEQTVGQSVLLAGPDGAALDIDGTATLLGAYGLLALPDAQVVHVRASTPIRAQIQGGGDRYFDLGDVLRSAHRAARTPGPVLHDVSIDASVCAVSVTASARIGNGGSGPLAAGMRLELLELGTGGADVIASETLDESVESGAFVDVELQAARVPSPGPHTFAVRLTPAVDGDPSLLSAPVTASCDNGAPVFVSEPPSSGVAGVPVLYAALAADPEGEAVTYALVDGPPGTSFDAAAPLLTWTPAHGEHAVFVISATDPGGATAVQSFAIAVVSPAGCSADVDGDGACASADCDDTTGAIGPAVVEVLGNGLDDDCSASTPDAAPLKAAGLTLVAESPVVAVGQPITLFATVRSAGGLQTLVGLDIAVAVDCGNEGWDEAASVPPVGPGAGVSVGVTRSEGAEAPGHCTAQATLRAGAVVLASATTSFTVTLPLVGTIALDDDGMVSWTVRSLSDASITADLTIGVNGLAAWDTKPGTVVPPLSTIEGKTAAPAGLLPALYVARLSADGVVLASVALDRPDAPVLRLVRADNGIPEEALASPIRYRALGPYPGGPEAGGTLRGAWNEDGIRLEVVVDDATADDEDATRVFVAAVDGAPVEVRWTRATGVVVPASVTATATPGPTGYVLAVEIPAALLGGGLPKDLLARVEVRDGPAGAPKGAWIWAGFKLVQAEGAIYGPVELIEPLPPQPDTAPDADGTPDAGPVLDAAVDSDATVDPDAAVDPDAQDQPGDVIQTPDSVDQPADVAEPPGDVGSPGEDLGGDVSGGTPDVGSEDVDAGSDGDATGTVTVGAEEDGGCGCRTTPKRSLPGGGVLVVLAFAAFALIRRRRALGNRGVALLATLFLGSCKGAEPAVVPGPDDVTEAEDVSDIGADLGTPGPGVDTTAPDVPVPSDSPLPDDGIGEDAVGKDVVGQDAVGEDAVGEDTAVLPEDVLPDVPLEDVLPDVPSEDVPPDVPTEDVLPDEDVGDTGSDASSPDTGPPLGGIGAACTGGGDCASNFCLQGADYAVCSASCETYPCPADWVCANWPGDTQVCVPKAACIDGDGDGWGVGRACLVADCNDEVEAISPGADETCDGVDQDCDGATDEGLTNACGTCGAAPAEICNGFDDDCDGDVDEGVTNACGGCGQVPSEICNGLDDDCDGAPDDLAGCTPAAGCTGPASCWPLSPDLLGAGTCAAGVRACTGGVLGPCENAVLPVTELCNAVDDDCDGATDEGVKNSCGICAPDPIEACNGKDDDCDGGTDEGVLSPCGGCSPCGQALGFPAEIGIADKGIAPAPDGGVTLGTGQVDYHYIWVPNSVEGSVSRWDTRTGREVSRYWVGTDPSRTSIDLDGNAWVGGRGDGKATHIFTNKSDCVDRNGNGVIDTSTDLNGDGVISYGEMKVIPGGDPLVDECVACQLHVGTPTDLVRGLAVDRENHVWLGTWNSAEIFRVDPVTCEIETTIPTNYQGGSLNLYGFAIAGTGSLWTSTLYSGCTLEVDTELGVPVRRTCTDHLLYGIAVDGAGRPWFGDNGRGVAVFDPELDKWTRHIEPSGALQEVDGVVVGIDGYVYGAGFVSNHIGRFDPITETWTMFSTAVGLPPGIKPQYNPRGVTIDSEGDLWAICKGSSALMEFTSQGLAKGSYDILGFDNPKAGTGPYSYSDNTGFQLFNFTVSEASWSWQFDAGAAVDFVKLAFHSFRPVGTTITVVARAAHTSEGLTDAVWTEALSGDQPGLEGLVASPARWLEVRVTLATTIPTVKPVLRDIRVFFRTSDCHSTPCPAGQLCEPVYGGCVVVPRECDADADCPASDWCDASGHCRVGCRLVPAACSIGSLCDPAQHLCIQVTAECKTDSECAEGHWCASGQCLEGCRLAPDSCPPSYYCDAGTHGCVASAPECDGDDACAEDEYCGGSGNCLTGCRPVGSCDDGFVCHASFRVCVLAPVACDPALPESEVCDGLDNDCNGKIDETFPEMGTTCQVGSEAIGVRVCYDGRTACRVTPAGPGEAPVSLVGILTDIVFPPGAYQLSGNVQMQGLMVLQGGATLTGTLPGPLSLAELRAYVPIDLRATDATIRGVTVGIHAGGSVRLSGALIEGTAGSRATFDVAAGPVTTLVARLSRFRDIAVTLGSGCDATIEHSRFDATDKVGRWLLTTVGKTLGKHIEIGGTNVLPRVHSGWLVYGPLTLEDSQIESLVTGMWVQTVSGVDVSRTVISVCDDGVAITGASFPAFADCTIDSQSPGHKALGFKFEGLTAGGGADIAGTTFLLDAYDRAFELDPDQFRTDTPSTITGSTFIGVSPAGQYGLRGVADGGAHVVTLLDEATEYSLTSHVHWGNATLSVSAPVTFRSVFPAYALIVYVTGASTLNLQNLQLTDVGLQIDAPGTAVIDGLTVVHTQLNDRVLIHVNGATATFTDLEVTGVASPTGDYRYGNSLNVYGKSVVEVTGARFENVRVAVAAVNESQVTVTDLEVTDAPYAIYVGNTAHLTLSDASITDTATAMVSRAIWGEISSGGVLALSDVAIDVGPEDMAVALDPDAYQVATPSSLSDVVGADGSALVPLLIGHGDGGAITLGPRNGLSVVHISPHNADVALTTFSVAPGMLVRGKPGYTAYLTLGNSTATVPAGVSWRDLILVSSGSVLTIEAADFAWTTLANGQLLYVAGGTAMIDSGKFRGFGHAQFGVEVQYGGTVTLDDVEFIDLNEGVRPSSGNTTITNGIFRSTDPTSGPSRRGAGLYARGDATASCTGCVFEQLQNGTVSFDNSKVIVTDCTFTGCAYGVYMNYHGTTSIASSTLVDTDPMLKSVGVWLDVAQGGALSVQGLAFDVGTEDTPLLLDPDAFQTLTPSTLTGVTFGAGPARVVVQGYGDVGDRSVGPLLAGVPVTVRGDVHFGGGTIALEPGLELVSEGVYLHLIVRDSAVLTTKPGVTFRNVALHVWGTGTADLDGTQFVYTNSTDQNILSIGGTLTGEGVTVTGNGRLQQGMVVGSGGRATLIGSTFAGLEYGVIVDDGGDVTLQSPVFTGVTTGGTVRGIAKLAVHGGTLANAPGEPASTGLVTQYARAGVRLEATDTHFDFGATDTPFRFDLEAFAAESVLVLAGTTFEDGEKGLGYRISGQSAAGAYALAPLEPAQTEYVLGGLVGVYGTATLALKAGTVLRSGAPTYSSLRAENAAHMTLEGVTAHDVEVSWRNDATGSIAFTSLDGSTAGLWTLAWTSSSAAAPLAVSGSFFASAGPNATQLQGLWAGGAGRAIVTGSTFEGLACGLATEGGGTITPTGVTFIGNQKNVCP